MKTSTVNRSWKAITNGFNKLIAAEGHKKLSLPSNNSSKNGVEKYSSWPHLGYRNLNFMVSELEVRPVNVRLLEQFVENVLPKDISYKNLISSHLQLGTDDRRSAADIKKMMAIKNLSHLVSTTIHEMKQIELNHIARNKG